MGCFLFFLGEQKWDAFTSVFGSHYTPKKKKSMKNGHTTLLPKRSQS